LARAKKATQIPVSVVLAHREFECRLLGSKESLRGINGIVENATAPPNPENIRGAKEHLTRNMTRGRRRSSYIRRKIRLKRCTATVPFL
jgi:hypothetical protein